MTSKTVRPVPGAQDSTALWEVLPPEVMNAAVSAHHALLRRVAVRHSGYESTTEGDSFHFAFHTAVDAARFAVEAQVVAAGRVSWRFQLSGLGFPAAVCMSQPCRCA